MHPNFDSNLRTGLTPVGRNIENLGLALKFVLSKEKEPTANVQAPASPLQECRVFIGAQLSVEFRIIRGHRLCPFYAAARGCTRIFCS